MVVSYRKGISKVDSFLEEWVKFVVGDGNVWWDFG